MKLLTRTSRYFLLFSVVLLAIGGVVMVFALDAVLTHQLDESLSHTRTVLRKELSKRDSVPAVLEIMDEVIYFSPVSTDVHAEFYRDTALLIYDSEDDELELEPFRKYVYTEVIAGKNYRVELNHTKFEKEDLALAMIGFLLGFLTLFLLSINLINRYISQRIWRPFHQIIEQIQQFNITDQKGIAVPESKTEEFALLAKSTSKMTNKLIKDYQSLKRFSENASHELQTPLAIILAQTDLLLQQPELKEDSARHLIAIQNASKRLTQLSRSLLLLAKINNKQFSVITSVRLDAYITQEIELLTPLLEHKNIQPKLKLTATTIRCNTELLTSLLQNLIGNAIKHNYKGGELAIFLQEKILVLQNTSQVSEIVDTKALFDRFYKNGSDNGSLGLGLAIVKDICELYSWKVQYEVAGNIHKVSIMFLES